MRIGKASLSEKVFVVAEIGNNHEGDFDVARELVKRAADCGVDAVKFQTFDTDHYVSRADATRHKRLRSFELSHDQFRELARLARALGLAFVSTPFDLASADFLEGIVDAFKIASGDNTFYPLIARVARSGKPVIVSTGLADLEQVGATADFVKAEWGKQGVSGQLAVLHCVSAYPVPPEQANLLAIRALREHLDCEVGYSDHTVGIEAAVLAVTIGARLIEKHFTLDKNYSDFRDHRLSADPPEMRLLVEKVQLASTLMGTSGKRVQPCELPGITTMRRSIVAARDLPRGHRLTGDDLTWIRPGGGLAPGQEGKLVGKTLKRAVMFGEVLQVADVEDSHA